MTLKPPSGFVVIISLIAAVDLMRKISITHAEHFINKKQPRLMRNKRTENPKRAFMPEEIGAEGFVYKRLQLRKFPQSRLSFFFACSLLKPSSSPPNIAFFTARQMGQEPDLQRQHRKSARPARVMVPKAGLSTPAINFNSVVFSCSVSTDDSYRFTGIGHQKKYLE